MCVCVCLKVSLLPWTRVREEPRPPARVETTQAGGETHSVSMTTLNTPATPLSVLTPRIMGAVVNVTAEDPSADLRSEQEVPLIRPKELPTFSFCCKKRKQMRSEL